jgi:hypothetical protein
VLPQRLRVGITRSFQQEEIPAAPAQRVQHDLHEAKCACGRTPPCRSGTAN